MSKVAELEQKIRDIFNIDRRHKKARSVKASFYQACSAMDAIGDTELALQEYISCNDDFSIGIRYILIYGALQAIFIQQNAIKHLAHSHGLQFNLPEELSKIRELRNDAIGHPTQRDITKKLKSYHNISRITLSKNHFQLLSTYSNKDDYITKNINLTEIINIQSKFAEELLSEIFNKIREDENSHREKYMNDKLTHVFHPSDSYFLQKIVEGIRNSEHREFALSNFEEVLQMINSLEQKLSERGKEESIEYIKKELEYPLEKVNNFLRQSGKVDQRAAEIFFDYIKKKVKELKKIAKEIDEEYESRI